jgi:hypothetical protein
METVKVARDGALRVTVTARRSCWAGSRFGFCMPSGRRRAARCRPRPSRRCCGTSRSIPPAPPAADVFPRCFSRCQFASPTEAGVDPSGRSVAGGLNAGRRSSVTQTDPIMGGLGRLPTAVSRHALTLVGRLQRRSASTSASTPVVASRCSCRGVSRLSSASGPGLPSSV